MKILRRLKDRRGIAIETAILFMLVIFSLCALITTVSIIGRRQTKFENDMLLYKVEVDQIGEDFIYYIDTDVRGGSGIKGFEVMSYEGYTLTTTSEEENKFTLAVTKNSSQSVVLFVRAQKMEMSAEGGAPEETTVKVIAWRYGE